MATSKMDQYLRFDLTQRIFSVMDGLGWLGKREGGGIHTKSLVAVVSTWVTLGSRSPTGQPRVK